MFVVIEYDFDKETEQPENQPLVESDPQRAQAIYCLP